MFVLEQFLRSMDSNIFLNLKNAYYVFYISYFMYKAKGEGYAFWVSTEALYKKAV